jgi:photosystem II stability/assembly factor-like uncharacterized protein
MKKITIIICLIISSLSICKAENGWDTVYHFKTNKYMLFDIAAKNNNVAIVGHNGVFLLSEDNGLHWKNIYTGTNSDINNLTFADDSTLFLCGNYGTIIKYNTNSRKFEDQCISPHIFILNIAFSDKDNGLAGCMRGRIFRTTNGGKTWDSVFKANNMNVESIVYKNSKEVFYCCSKYGSDTSEIYYSSNAGLNWTKKVFLKSEKINTLTYIDNELWIGGSYGLLASSTDDGKNWEFYNFDVNAPVWKIVKSNNEIYVPCGYYDFGIVKVIPGTDNFSLDLSCYTKSLFDLTSNKEYIFTVNDDLGIIYRKKK